MGGKQPAELQHKTQVRQTCHAHPCSVSSRPPWSGAHQPQPEAAAEAAGGSSESQQLEGEEVGGASGASLPVEAGVVYAAWRRVLHTPS